ncbi:MAG: PaaI family thioesterase [candidate division WOR-3 bacterium]
MVNKDLVKSSDYCFACGKKNPIGFHLEIKEEGEGVKTTWQMRREYEGYQNIAHGGIIATLLDEMCAWACRKKGYLALTGELKVRLKRPLTVGESVKITGRILEKRKNLLLCRSEMRNERGELVAFAEAKMVL